MNNNFHKCQCGELINVRSKLCRSCRPCQGCKRILSKENYSQRKSGKYRTRCKECECKSSKKLRNSDPEKYRKRARDYNRLHPEKVRIWGRRNGWRKMGFDANEIEKLMEQHEGKCDICKEKTEKILNVDHCHSTGGFRGFLCSNCNAGLGMFRDNPTLLLKAISYLNSYTCRIQAPIPDLQTPEL